MLLPGDNIASGFDNLADRLFVSPTTMDQYLGAAQKLVRLAIGAESAPPIADAYRFPDQLPQDSQVDGLPDGTRSGMKIRTILPADGEYVLRIEFDGRVRKPERVEVGVDGERVRLFTVGGPAPPATPLIDGRLEARLALKAGPRELWVTFLPHTAAREDAIVNPSRREPIEQVGFQIIAINGPLNAMGPGDTPSRKKIFTCHPTGAVNERACASQILSNLGRLAYRHTPSAADLKDLLTFYESGRKEGPFETGIEWGLERMLISPQFLFRIEADPARVPPGGVYRVSDLELASRLSFLMWSSIPDHELLDAAEAGRLKDPAVLERQVRRMLADPRSKTLVTNFADQWLYVNDVKKKFPDRDLYANFDEGLRRDLQTETELFVDNVLRNDRSALELLTADYSFLNERLAKHYGIPGIYGSRFRRVTFGPDVKRRGLLGQGSVLTLTSQSTRTSPVLRGKWILENVIGYTPPPPPANVPALPSDPDAKPLSMREAMEKHRANPVCATCHAVMDPLGFALESYDAVGQWRNVSDVSGSLPSGEKFDGGLELVTVLAGHTEEFSRTIWRRCLAG